MSAVQILERAEKLRHRTKILHGLGQQQGIGQGPSCRRPLSLQRSVPTRRLSLQTVFLQRLLSQMLSTRGLSEKNCRCTSCRCKDLPLQGLVTAKIAPAKNFKFVLQRPVARRDVMGGSVNNNECTKLYAFPDSYVFSLRPWLPGTTCIIYVLPPYLLTCWKENESLPSKTP